MPRLRVDKGAIKFVFQAPAPLCTPPRCPRPPEGPAAAGSAPRPRSRSAAQGANIMCPGLTSKGATIHDDVPEDTPVAIYAEGKEHAMAVGLTKMSTEDIKRLNKGHGVETLHHLNDGLYKEYTVEMHC